MNPLQFITWKVINRLGEIEEIRVPSDVDFSNLGEYTLDCFAEDDHHAACDGRTS